MALISHELCNEDGRVVWVRLISNGSAMLKKLAKLVAEMHASQFGGVTEKELATLNRMLFKARGKQ